MWFTLRSEDLGFIDRAAAVHTAEATLAASRARVFAAFAEPATWPAWFPNVQAAAYTTPPPHGVGTIREARVGGTRWVEEMIAWDDGRRSAWTVTGASVPLATAQVESFEVTDLAGGTRIRWTLALEPRLLARLGAPFMASTISRLLQRAMDELGVYLRRR
jgi:uncharacterized protein YndB with AHSA1/START domain